MLIWGNKTRRKRLGRVADYCEICRRICAFELFEIHTDGIKYYERPPHERLPGAVCETCGTSKPTQLGRYDSFWGDPNTDLDTLIDLTHHSIAKTRERELALAERLKRGQLDEDERRTMIYGTLVHMETSLIQRADGVHVDGRTFIEILLMIAAIAGMWAWLSYGPYESPLLSEDQWACVMGFFALCRIAWLLLTEDYRFARRVLQPRLVEALAPLKPTYEELREMFEALDRTNVRVGDRFSARSIYRDLQRLQKI